ncbi:MAG: glycosyltransferase [Chitinivibrionales bacterium]|nr:glycosyltransferase [Chitinivibrionales bacterium]
MPAISVIIPTHNRLELFKQALSSAEHQSCKPREIVVVVDGSTDGTVEYVNNLASNTLRVLVNSENRGGAHSRNQGAKITQGDWLAFLDDDDVWHADKLEKQAAIINDAPAALCYSGATVITRKGCRKRHSFYAPKYGDQYKSIMFDNFIGTTSSVIIKKKVFDACGGFDPELSALQDYDLYIRVLKDYNSVWTDESLVDYRVVAENKNVSCSKTSFDQAKACLIRKYKASPYIGLLKRSLRLIEAKKVMKSSHYFLQYARSLIWK